MTDDTTATERPPDYVFTWGKHKGKSIREIPNSYLRWCGEKLEAAERPDCRAAYEEYKWRIARMMAAKQGSQNANPDPS